MHLTSKLAFGNNLPNITMLVNPVLAVPCFSGQSYMKFSFHILIIQHMEYRSTHFFTAENCVFYRFLADFKRLRRRFFRLADPIFRRPLPVALTPILVLLLVFIVSDHTKLLQIRLRIVYHQVKCKTSPASLTKKRVYLVI